MREAFRKAALRLYEYCAYPAARYKILFRFLDTPYEDKALRELRPAFHASDLVEELCQEQDYNGGWGPLQSKDYSVKARFPTSMTAISRCLYIGLTIEDRDLLLRAYEYLEDFLKGTSREKLYKGGPVGPHAVRVVAETARSAAAGVGRGNAAASRRTRGAARLVLGQNAGGLWDWDPQTKDPWGYFGYFSTNRNYKHNRIVDCSMEVLNFLKTYIDHNKETHK